MFTARVARVIAGKVGFTVSCFLAAVVLVVSGYAYKVVGLTTSVANGITIGGSSSVGAMNILVMGLESRTDYYGNVLSNSLLTAMHAGNAQSVAAGQVGSQDTNTLILIHIFAGGQKAVGFSIPRDSLVTYPQAYFDGITRGKIDGAYAYAYNASLSKTVGSSLSHDQRFLDANQAGQAAEIATVQSVTGQHIDHFAEVNLAGFYYLAQAFGGMEVCIKPAPAQGGLPAGANLTDKDVLTGTDNSGFNAYHDGYNRKKGGAQYLHLSSPQSLAYVRSRDTLPGVDVGRTHRQQAVIDYANWELKHEGAFSDLAKITGLLGVAKNWLITDSGWKILDFGANMRALTGKNLTFQTLPGTPENGVPVPGYPNPQDVININVPYIQQLVKNTFDPPPAVKKTPVAKKGTAKKATPTPPASTVTVDVYNGGTQPGLATQVSQALVAKGYKAGAIGNASAQSQTVETGTQVFYGAGTSANAAKIAVEIGTTAKALASLPAGHVEVLLGSTSTAVPAGLTTSSSPSAGTQSASPTPPAPAGSQSATRGSTVTVGANAPYGIPCVY
jgi:anionic cell wall polymer biosynthesis LytR-Cps2A-Psr (LCP) family protein